MLTCVVDRKPRSDKSDYSKIGRCCFTKHVALRSKSKYWLAWNHNNLSRVGWHAVSLLFQWASTIKIQLSVLVYYKASIIIILLKCNLFLPWYGWTIAHLALNNNQSYHSSVMCCLKQFSWNVIIFTGLDFPGFLHGSHFLLPWDITVKAEKDKWPSVGETASRKGKQKKSSKGSTFI